MKHVVYRTVRRALFAGVLLVVLIAGARFQAFAVKSVTLAWSPVSQADVAGYIVYYGKTSGSYTAAVAANTGTSAAISGLTEGVTYFFAVSAYDSLGMESERSNEVSYSVPAPPSGVFNGLFQEANEVRPNSAGSFSVTITSGSTYSGRLQLGIARFSFTGRFNSQGRATNAISRSGSTPLTVELDVETGIRTGEIFGRVTDGTWNAELFGQKAEPASKTNPSRLAGTYTVVMPSQEEDPAVPAGHSFGSVRIDSSGLLRLAGTLADGTKISQSVSVCSGGQWPLYIPLYSGKGLVTGWISFTSSEPSTDLKGALSWIKLPDSSARYYPKGFANKSQAMGSTFTSLAGSDRVLNLTRGSVAFIGGNLASDFTKVVMSLPGGKPTLMGGPGITMNFSLTTGLFTGKVTGPSGGKPLSFSGAVLQKLNLGCGFLLGTNAGSRIILSPVHTPEPFFRGVDITAW